jgi:hypothetical protein
MMVMQTDAQLIPLTAYTHSAASYSILMSGAHSAGERKPAPSRTNYRLIEMTALGH